MKYYLKVLFFCVLSFVFCNKSIMANDAVSEIRKKGYMTLATNAEFEPFEYKDGNDIVGIDIDISREIAKRIGVELKITDVSFDALPLELSGGNCDFAAAAISYSEDKAKNVGFSDPYFDAKQAIIVPSNSQIEGKDDLYEKKIGVHMGTTGDLYCTENLKSSQIFRYNKGSEAVLDMVSGRIDAVVIDNLPAKKLVDRNRGGIKTLNEYLFEEQYRIVVPKGSDGLLSVINVILTEMKNDGSMDFIVEKYENSVSGFGEGIWGLIYEGLIYKDRYKGIIDGFITTLKITCGALIIGIAIGIIIATIKLSSRRNIFMRILKWISDLYLLVIRGTPVVVQLFVIYYLIFVSTGLEKISVAMIAFGINSGAYVSVVIRSGILSVDKGQYEAGRSLGLSNRTVMLKIIIPQALKNVLATLCNEFIDLIKETSVAGFIGIMDLSRAGDIIRSQTLDPFVPLITVALIYFITIFLLSSLMSMLERRLRKSDVR